jgi:hypothetical protein
MPCSARMARAAAEARPRRWSRGVAGYVWRALRWLVPALTYWWVHRQLPLPRAQAREEKDQEKQRGWVQALSGNPEATDIAGRIYEAELKRLEGLEAKLRTQLNYVMALSPVTTGILAAAWGQQHLGSVSVAAAAVAQLILSFGLTLKGTSARPTRLGTRSELSRILKNGDDLGAHWAATLLVATEDNEPIGIDLNNAISVVRGSLMRAAVLVGIAGGLLV